MSKYTAKLEASPPWGFRLQGGRDFNMPLTLSRVTPGSKADRVSMEPGDLVMSINGLSTDGMTHLEAQNHIKANTGVLHLGMQRGTRVPPVPTATPIIETAPVVIPHQRVVQLNLSNTSRSSGYQAQSLAIPLRPKNLPSEGPMNIRVAAGPSATITHAQYNTPISLYSSNAILATIAGQARALGADITGLSQDTSLQPKDVPVDTTSPVFQAVVKSCEEEDWSNKSSASQSRSFNILAQMTGTHNDDSVPEQTSSGQSGSKGSLPNVNSRSTALIAHHLAPGQQQRPEPQPVATATVAVKTVSRKPPVTSPARQPVGLSTSKNVVQAPSFSRVTDEPRIVQRSSPSSSRKEGGLLQQVEHVPAGIRTPLCGHCGSVIRGPFLIAEGRSWHKDEFCCCRCKQSLAETGYVPESEKIYCQGCYAQLFAPACSKCKEKIVGEVTYALKQAFHSQCFLCAACGTPIGKSTFHMEDGEPYCDKDFYSLFSTKCLGCDFPVEAGDRFIEALGSTWHDTCFMCTVCQVNLEGQQFYSKNGKPLCRKHAG
uniref:LIM domain-binding protein 3-like isoform X5 n=1 Tax=Myxine glutinosa TaxID=7769 RepID=UPI00358FD1D5